MIYRHDPANSARDKSLRVRNTRWIYQLGSNILKCGYSSLLHNPLQDQHVLAMLLQPKRVRFHVP